MSAKAELESLKKYVEETKHKRTNLTAIQLTLHEIARCDNHIMLKALRDIAKQPTVDEAEDAVKDGEEEDVGDIECGYDTIIQVARDTLTKLMSEQLASGAPDVGMNLIDFVKHVAAGNCDAECYVEKASKILRDMDRTKPKGEGR